MMRFEVLGPLAVHNGQAALDLRTHMLRRLLAALLTSPSDPIHMPSLVDALWPDAPPANAEKTVQIYIHRLRKKLATLGGPGRIVRHPTGYAIVVRSGELDADEFVQLVRSAGGEQELTRALRLWRGRPFSELAGCAFVRPHVHKLTELRISAVENRAAILLEQGRHTELLSELAALVKEFPYREGLSALLMLALYGSGQRAEALRVYRHTRDVLAEDLGAEPGADLHRLYDQVRHQDPALRRRPGRPTGPGPITPAQLPGSLGTFTGRDSELTMLSSLAETRPGTAIVGAIDGMAGIGKTTLAIQAGHRLARHFPDGQIFLDLHGFTKGVPPLSPATALDRLLRTIGVPGEQIPPELDERAAWWRSSLTDKRVLLILDNAAGEDQVRPLLPDSASCLVLVTSRHRLSGLDDAYRLTLPQLGPADAKELLVRAAAPRNLAGEPEQDINDLVQLTGGLPLALRLAAIRLRDRPRWRLADLVSRMRDEQRRLTELSIGERGVVGVFEVSYLQLPAEQQRLFRLLGAHPGADFDAYAAAALAGGQPRDVRSRLETFVDSHVLQSRSGDRYLYHDLLRAFAAEKVRGDEFVDERRAALRRLLGSYLDSVLNAMDAYSPQERDTRPRPPESGCAARSFRTFDEALTWLDTERANLIAVADLADEAGRPEYVGLLSELLARYLGHQSHHADALLLHEQALARARANHDQPGEAGALKHLGAIYAITGPNPRALDCFQQALTHYERLGDKRSEADVKRRLGQVLGWMGRLREAYALCTEAVDHYRVHGGHGDVLGNVRALRDLGVVCRQYGKPDEALVHYERGLELARESGDLINEASILGGVAAIQHSLGRFEDALGSLRQVLRMRAATGHPGGTVATRVALGNAFRELGRHHEALDHQWQALSAAEHIGSTNGECDARRAIGSTLIAMGRADEALPHLDRALELEHRRGHPAKAVQVHEALGRAYRTLGQPRRAGEHEERARRLSAELRA